MARSAGTEVQPSVGLTIGGVLVAVGVGLLFARAVEVGPHLWVVFVLLPGLIVLALGLFSADRRGLILTIAGCIIASKGLLLLWSTAADRVEVWAYGWPLSFPGAVGLGILVRGLLRADAEVISIGGRLALAGLGLFALFFLLFEGMVFNTFAGAFGVVVPLLLLGAGTVLVVRSLRVRV